MRRVTVNVKVVEDDSEFKSCKSGQGRLWGLCMGT